MDAKRGCYSVVRYVGFVALSLTSFLPVSCRSPNTALLREDIAENYRYFLFSDTDDNGKFDLVVISDTPESTSDGIRERILGEPVVQTMYDLLSKRRFKKITGQEYAEEGIEGKLKNQSERTTENNTQPPATLVEN